MHRREQRTAPRTQGQREPCRYAFEPRRLNFELARCSRLPTAPRCPRSEPVLVNKATSVDPRYPPSMATSSFVPFAQAVRGEQQQHLGDLRGLAAQRRHDRRGEPPARRLVHAPVVHPRGPDLDRAGRRRDLPRLVVAVADDQAAAPGVALISQLRSIEKMCPSLGPIHRSRSLLDSAPAASSSGQPSVKRHDTVSGPS